MNRIILLGVLASLTACTAPQGKKIAMNDGLAPVASGPGMTMASGTDMTIASTPAVRMSEVTINNEGQVIGLSPAKTLTVTLPSSNRNGYSWRLAEIPDPTVLKMVSQEFIPGPDLRTSGEQKIVFEGTGVGEVPVKMWYGTLWASDMNATRPFHFTVSVTPEEAKKSEKKSTTAGTPKKKRVHNTARGTNTDT